MSLLYSGGFRSTDSEAMNKIGKLLRDEPTLSRVMASKKHIYYGDPPIFFLSSYSLFNASIGEIFSGFIDINSSTT